MVQLYCYGILWKDGSICTGMFDTATDLYAGNTEENCQEAIIKVCQAYKWDALKIKKFALSRADSQQMSNFVRKYNEDCVAGFGDERSEQHSEPDFGSGISSDD